MLRIKSTIYLTGQANNNDRNSKIPPGRRPDVPTGRRPNKVSAWKVLVIEYWNLKFICNLELGICDFRHKTPRQSQISLTWPKGPSFSGLNKMFTVEGIYAYWQ
jgi:hypothetical protein